MEITTTCLLPFPNCVVRNMMAAFQSVSKQFPRGRSFPEGTFFSLWRTRIQISSGSPILLRYCLSYFIYAFLNTVFKRSQCRYCKWYTINLVILQCPNKSLKTCRKNQINKYLQNNTFTTVQLVLLFSNAKLV